MITIKRLHDYRCLQCLSQKELADNLGISQQMVSQYEQGQCVPALPVALKIARYFGVAIEDLIEEKEVMNNGRSR